MRSSVLFYFSLRLPMRAPPKTMTAAQFEASLKYKKARSPFRAAWQTLKIPDSFRYLDPKDAERVLVQAWGNPSGDAHPRHALPAGASPVSDNGWGVVITYEEDGYVSDKDADSINYDSLIKEMKEGTAESNKEREKQGYQTVDLCRLGGEALLRQRRAQALLGQGTGFRRER